MGTPSRLEGDHHINGHLTMKTAALPAGTLTDAMVNGSAAIAVGKQQHQYEKSWSDLVATTITAKDTVLHVVHGTTGEILAFKGGAVVAPLTTEVWNIDLHKNGTTVMSAGIVLNSSATSYEIISGTVGTTAVVAGDVLEAVITETTGTGTAPAGVFCEVIIKEDQA